MPIPKYDAIYNWKNRGLIYDNYDELYEVYINTTECQRCKKEFTEKNKRCLDHDHTTGLFRKIVCHRCNVHDSYIKYPNGYTKQAYYQANKEQIKEYYQANKEQRQEYNQEYNQEYQRANKEQIKEQKKEYYQANKEQRQEYNQEYQRANKDKISAYKKEKIECECGSIVCRSYIAQHKRSKKHSDYKLNNLV